MHKDLTRQAMHRQASKRKDLIMEVPDVEGCREGALLSGAIWRIMGTSVWLLEVAS